MARLDPFWRVICDYRHFLFIGASFAIFYVILGIFALLFAPWGSAHFAIAVIDLVLALALLAATLWMFYVCKERRDANY